MSDYSTPRARCQYIDAPAARASRCATSAIVIAWSFRRRASIASVQTSAVSVDSSGAQPALERLDDLEDGDLLGRAGERVAALHAALALQDPRAPQRREQALEELDRDVAAAGDLADRHRAGGARASQLRQRADGVGDFEVMVSTRARV